MQWGSTGYHTHVSCSMWHRLASESCKPTGCFALLLVCLKWSHLSGSAGNSETGPHASLQKDPA
jgi:hypothetical protein